MLAQTCVFQSALSFGLRGVCSGHNASWQVPCPAQGTAPAGTTANGSEDQMWGLNMGSRCSSTSQMISCHCTQLTLQLVGRDRSGSALKSTCYCSCRRPELCSQHPNQVAHNHSNSSFKKTFPGTCTHNRVHTHTKLNLKKNKQKPLRLQTKYVDSDLYFQDLEEAVSATQQVPGQPVLCMTLPPNNTKRNIRPQSEKAFELYNWGWR